jgi:hypothetical protein
MKEMAAKLLRKETQSLFQGTFPLFVGVLSDNY